MTLVHCRSPRLASSRFGPRLLRNFMRDIANQVVLGTFVYCLLVLRTIRRADEAAFVRHLSVSIGVLLAMVSIGVLIYFIHHVSVSIQADVVVARVSRALEDGIGRLFPGRLGKPESEASNAPGEAGLCGFPALGYYNASKFAVEGLSAALRLDHLREDFAACEAVARAADFPKPKADAQA